MKERCVIIKYMGGLGNQMFQYALGQVFKNKGYKVLGDIRWYERDDADRDFLLPQIFPNVEVEIDEAGISKRFEKQHTNRNFICKVYQYFFRNSRVFYYEKQSYLFEPNVFKVKNALIDGYWQSYKYYEDIKEKILEEFKFPPIKSKELIAVSDRIIKNKITSIHVRGGDYLQAENKNFGNNCDGEYYSKAIKFIKEKESQAIFWGFTDDLEYAKQIVSFAEVEWLDIKQMTGYEDWMDMYFMSLCKNNILANSSFSWWGAYLNQNIGKIVIAPKKWDKRVVEDEMCPDEWIRI